MQRCPNIDLNCTIVYFFSGFSGDGEPTLSEPHGGPARMQVRYHYGTHGSYIRW